MFATIQCVTTREHVIQDDGVGGGSNPGSITSDGQSQPTSYPDNPGGRPSCMKHEALASRLPRGFEKPRVAPKGRLLPEFFHAPTRSSWLFVPRLQFRMGFSASEEWQARALEDPPPLSLEEMRPTRKVEVAPFLMMKEPMS